jgi:hypothetical protein
MTRDLPGSHCSSKAFSMAVTLCHLYPEADLLIEQGLSKSTPPDMVKEFHELKALVQQHKLQYEQLSDKKEEQPFWISGVLKRADAEKNTIKLATNGTEPKSQPHYYTINVVSETLNKLVKNYWGDIINVYIKPKSTKGKQHRYELIEVS